MEHTNSDTNPDFIDNHSTGEFSFPTDGQRQNIQTFQHEEEGQVLQVQNSKSGDDGDIRGFNMEYQPHSGDGSPEVAHQRRKELTDEDRAAVYGFMLQKSVNGKLKKGATGEASRAFNISMRSAQRLWKRGKESGHHNISLSRVTNCGRKRVQVDMEKIRDIPLRKRTTLRNLSAALKVSRGTLSSKLKSGELRRHTNAIKPILTEGNRLRRIEHCLSMMDPDSEHGNPTFSDMSNVVHIDEKWFQMTKKTQTYYLLASEDDPVRKIKSSNFIPKIMFLAAVARPRYDPAGNCIFDGKIGVFPLVNEVAAVRSSVNRLAGSLEVKAIDKIDRQVIREFMITKVLPAIRERWPTDSIEDEIIIQQDNAKTHILPEDVEFHLAANALGLNVKLLCQPPNSPDLNVLDLGFFRAIQSLQEKQCAGNVIELVAAVKKSFCDFSDRKCNYIFLTLQSCMVEILKLLGNNTYRIPHMSKESLDRHGMLPSRLSCDPVLVATVRANLIP